MPGMGPRDYWFEVVQGAVRLRLAYRLPLAVSDTRIWQMTRWRASPDPTKDGVWLYPEELLRSARLQVRERGDIRRVWLCVWGRGRHTRPFEGT